MANVKVVADVLLHCPLLKKDIPDSHCYDINLVALGLCIPELINNITDRETAWPVCSTCKNMQID